MKLLALVAVPAPVVTEILPVVAPVGTRARILVAEKTEEEVEAVPLNCTADTPLKPVPLMVTKVLTGPLVGEKLVTESPPAAAEVAGVAVAVEEVAEEVAGRRRRGR